MKCYILVKIWIGIRSVSGLLNHYSNKPLLLVGDYHFHKGYWNRKNIYKYILIYFVYPFFYWWTFRFISYIVFSQFSSVLSLSRVRLFVTPWIAALQPFLSITNSRSLLKLMSIESVMPSHLLLSPSPPAPNPSQHQGLFQWVNSSHEVAKVLELQLQHQFFQWTPRTDLL